MKSITLFAEFDEPARAALLAAVELNRADLDAMAADKYQREQMAGAQDTPEAGYEVEHTK